MVSIIHWAVLMCTKLLTATSKSGKDEALSLLHLYLEPKQYFCWSALHHTPMCSTWQLLTKKLVLLFSLEDLQIRSFPLSSYMVTYSTADVTRAAITIHGATRIWYLKATSRKLRGICKRCKFCSTKNSCRYSSREGTQPDVGGINNIDKSDKGEHKMRTLLLPTPIMVRIQTQKLLLLAHLRTSWW